MYAVHFDSEGPQACKASDTSCAEKLYSSRRCLVATSAGLSFEVHFGPLLFCFLSAMSPAFLLPVKDPTMAQTRWRTWSQTCVLPNPKRFARQGQPHVSLASSRGRRILHRSHVCCALPLKHYPNVSCGCGFATPRCGQACAKSCRTANQPAFRTRCGL